MPLRQAAVTPPDSSNSSKHHYCFLSLATHRKQNAVSITMARLLLLAASVRRPRGPTDAKAAIRPARRRLQSRRLKCLDAADTNFLASLEDRYYSSSVTFDDPLNS